MTSKFSHLDEDGAARMVDVSNKTGQLRIARAEGLVCCSPETIRMMREKALPKGDVISVARIAGIMAAKKTAELIPLCHPLALTHADVQLAVQEQGVFVSAEVRCTGSTGVEMEALTAVSIAALTIYDMCKAVDKNMVITGVRVVEKIKK